MVSSPLDPGSWRFACQRCGPHTPLYRGVLRAPATSYCTFVRIRYASTEEERETQLELNRRRRTASGTSVRRSLAGRVERVHVCLVTDASDRVDPNCSLIFHCHSPQGQTLSASQTRGLYRARPASVAGKAKCTAATAPITNAFQQT